MHALLQRANLTSHGYKNETTTKLVSEPGSNKELFKKSIFYYKIVNCARLPEIDQELQKLLPGKMPIRISRFFSYREKPERHH